MYPERVSVHFGERSSETCQRGRFPVEEGEERGVTPTSEGCTAFLLPIHWPAPGPAAPAAPPPGQGVGVPGSRCSVRAGTGQHAPTWTGGTWGRGKAGRCNTSSARPSLVPSHSVSCEAHLQLEGLPLSTWTDKGSSMTPQVTHPFQSAPPTNLFLKEASSNIQSASESAEAGWICHAHLGGGKREGHQWRPLNGLRHLRGWTKSYIVNRTAQNTT